MDIDGLLDAHEQDPDKRPAVGQVRAYRDAIADTEKYRDAEHLKADITTKATQAGADDLRARLAERARTSANTLKARDDHERERLETMNGVHIDPQRFTVASTAGEISALLRDAEVDPDSLRRAWAFALPRLREMAAREMREHRLPSGTSAFSAMTIWQGKLAGLTRTAPTRVTLTDRAAREQRDLKEKVLAVWRVVGLDHAVARHLLVADIQARTDDNGEPAKGALQVGRWFDQFGSTRK